MDYFGTSQPKVSINDRLIEFFQDSLRPVSWVYTAWLFLTVILSVTAYVISASNAVTQGLLIYYTILSVHVIKRFVNGGKANVLAPDIMFLLFYTLFHLGYVTLYALGKTPFFGEVFYYEDSIARGLLIVNLGLIGFIFGLEVAGVGAQASIGQRIYKIPPNSWCTAGMFFVVLALVIHLAGLTLVGPWRIIAKGYGAFSSESLIDVWPAKLLLNRSIYIFTIGIVLYLIASALRYGKLFCSKIVLGITVAFLALFVLEGDRGPILKVVAPMLMVRHYFIKRIRIRYLAVMFFGLMFLFMAIGLVRTIAMNPAKMVEEYKFKKSTGVATWEKPFLEMGGSFLVVNIVANDVPGREPYWRGQSWMSAALHVVPSLYGFCFRRGWVKTAPSEWVTYTYFGRGTSGRGFTVAAEGYLNFGLVGVFVELMFCGFFIRRLTVWFSRSPSSIRAFIMLGCVAAIFSVIRSYMYTVSDMCFHIFLAGILLNSMLGEGEAFEIVDYDHSSEDYQAF